jgi:hypothetical protein
LIQYNIANLLPKGEAAKLQQYKLEYYDVSWRIVHIDKSVKRTNIPSKIEVQLSNNCAVSRSIIGIRKKNKLLLNITLFWPLTLYQLSFHQLPQ